MGLDAVVYTHKNNLQIDTNSNMLQVDEETGEVFIADDNLASNYPNSSFVAVQCRLGNSSNIGYLNEEIANLLPNETSLLLEKVVYSGSHSGDKIDLEELDQLETEINRLKQQLPGQRTVLLEQFIQNMTELIQAARREGNPIVFV
ncbi:hypothetical protein [Leptolyngbya sp. 7M]|uniref:hypothetical protein n=1 Tax=Leptolyngbya sp. 7M TaxID=2812896 RepID=UPI001B8C26AB|nr:hypothetical protein [Leptolyngbya sp. 7M]QYO62231.1 hypothetical protein JVX88_19195 [Leptolyngbya sp. 7M]